MGRQARGRFAAGRSHLTVDLGETGFASMMPSIRLTVSVPGSGGGLSTTLRDLARFGEAMRCDGSFNGQQVVPASVVDDIRRGASRDQFATAGYATLPGWSYRNMWWVTHDAHHCFTARGIHGQLIWIDPLAEMVIARYASHPMAANVS